jgi:hypothetical protein
MRFRMFQRTDHRGMLVLVPLLRAPSAAAQEKHGPLEAVGTVDAERETAIDWGSVQCELDIYGYATLPRDALSRPDVLRSRRMQSS